MNKKGGLCARWLLGPCWEYNLLVQKESRETNLGRSLNNKGGQTKHPNNPITTRRISWSPTCPPVCCTGSVRCRGPCLIFVHNGIRTEIIFRKAQPTRPEILHTHPDLDSVSDANPCARLRLQTATTVHNNQCIAPPAYQHGLGALSSSCLQWLDGMTSINR